MSKNKKPPQLFLQFFRWFCHPELRTPIEGDLLELYEEQLQKNGKKKANLKFIIDVLFLFRPSIIRPSGGTYRLNNYGMFKNYFKVTWRSLLKNKMYSVINIGGLTVGLICFMLIHLYVEHENSYDQYLPNSNKIYRIYNQQEGNNFLGNNSYAVTPAGLASALMNEYPEVTFATTFDSGEKLITHNSKDYFLEKGIEGDDHFFDVFQHHFIEGDQKSALTNPESIVLSQSLAKKLFKNKSAIGKEILFRKTVYIVSGVFKDLPVLSSMQFSFVMNIHSNSGYLEAIKKEKWNSNSYQTYLTIAPPANPHLLAGKLDQIINKYWIDVEQYPQKYLVESLADVRFNNQINFDWGINKGNRQQMLFFTIIGVLILILAVINYMNLAIARSMNRGKEVGIRKVIGAMKSQLTFQFLSESVLLSLISLLITLVSIPFLVPIFGNLLGRPLDFDLSKMINQLPLFLLIVFVIGIISGSYPAIFMSAFKPVKVLKGIVDRKTANLSFQKILIIGQYSVSIVMIISSLIIYRQYHFIQNKELGLAKDHILAIKLKDRGVKDNYEVIKEEWLSNPNIIAVTGSQNLPTNVEQSTIVNDGNTDPTDDLPIYQLRTDYDFLNVFEIDLLSGRYFSKEYTDNLNVCVINETAAARLGWSAKEAIGKVLSDDWRAGDRKVIGVVKDFHIHSLHLAIEPMLIELRKPRFNKHISFKIRPENISETISFIEESISDYTNHPFDYQFLDDSLDQLYKEDVKQGKIFGFFTGLTIFIASLGLFGLAAFSTQQRIKEIGIRKVLGASVQSIIFKLTWGFIRLIIIGFIIAIPFAWFGMERWLNDFAYHIDISWWLFAIAGLAVACIALFTVTLQALKAALTNPVNCLRNE